MRKAKQMNQKMVIENPLTEIKTTKESGIQESNGDVKKDDELPRESIIEFLKVPRLLLRFFVIGYIW